MGDCWMDSSVNVGRTSMSPRVVDQHALPRSLVEHPELCTARHCILQPATPGHNMLAVLLYQHGG